MTKILSSRDLGNAIRQARISQGTTQSTLAAISSVGIRPTCVLNKALNVAQILGINLTAK